MAVTLATLSDRELTSLIANGLKQELENKIHEALHDAVLPKIKELAVKVTNDLAGKVIMMRGFADFDIQLKVEFNDPTVK